MTIQLIPAPGQVPGLVTKFQVSTPIPKEAFQYCSPHCHLDGCKWLSETEVEFGHHTSSPWVELAARALAQGSAEWEAQQIRLAARTVRSSQMKWEPIQ